MRCVLPGTQHIVAFRIVFFNIFLSNLNLNDIRRLEFNYRGG